MPFTALSAVKHRLAVGRPLPFNVRDSDHALLLARGELHMIGATTVDEYRKHVEKDPALERRFQPITVSEPNVEDTIAILRGIKQR